MSRSKLTQDYKDRRFELIRRIELCESNKKRLIRTVQKLKKNYDYGLINYSQYDKKLKDILKGRTPEQWVKYYDDSIKYYNNELEKCERNINSFKNVFTFKNILIALFMFTMIGSMFFLTPAITGYFTAKGPNITFVDGYENEGMKWAEIKGSMMYARCLEVNSEMDFESVKIDAKVTSASDTKDLTLALYSDGNKEPKDEIDNCRVDDYSNIWKSCMINNLELEKGKYWICAYSPSGDVDITYFTIAHQTGDNKTRALFTGDYWQKLERASYTIKAEFIKW